MSKLIEAKRQVRLIDTNGRERKATLITKSKRGPFDFRFGPLLPLYRFGHNGKGTSPLRGWKIHPEDLELIKGGKL